MEQKTHHERKRALRRTLHCAATETVEQIEVDLGLPRIESVEDAVRHLESLGRYLTVQLEILPPRWKVVRRGGDFSASLSDIELMEFARQQCPDAFEDALRGLREMGIEVIGITDGWILRTTDGCELTCDSEADLIDYASCQSNVRSGRESADADTSTASGSGGHTQ